MLSRMLYASAIMLSGLSVAHPIAQARQTVVVDPGFEFYEVLPGSFVDFAGPLSIPAGFFGPGSDVFEGSVAVQGLPLGAVPGCTASTGATSVAFLHPTRLTVQAGVDACLNIGLVAASLESSEPFRVSYNGGKSHEEWTLKVSIRSPDSNAYLLPQALFLTGPYGGTSGTEGPGGGVMPVVQFTRVTDGETRVLDYLIDRGSGGYVNRLYANWCVMPPPGLLQTPCSASFRLGVDPTSSVGTVTTLGTFRLNLQWTRSEASTSSKDLTWGAVKVRYR